MQLVYTAWLAIKSAVACVWPYHVRFLSENVGTEALWSHPLDGHESPGLCFVVVFAVDVPRQPKISHFYCEIICDPVKQCHTIKPLSSKDSR